MVTVSLWWDTTTVAPLPAVEAGTTVLGLLGIAGDIAVGTVVWMMAGAGVILTSICVVCDWLGTAGGVGLAVVGANAMRVTLALALVVMSGFTLGAKVCVAPGPLPTTA